MPASQKPPKKMKLCSSLNTILAQDTDEGELTAEHAMKRAQYSMRKVRIICTDPDATDSSSDEEDEGCFQNVRHLKRVVREMLIPAAACTEATRDHSCLTPDCQLLHTPASSPLPLLRKTHSRCSSKRSSKKWRLRPPVAAVSPQPQPEPRLLHSDKTFSRYIGVRQRRWGQWTAEFREPSQGVRMWLGTFDTAKEAAIAHDDAARQVNGPEAITNFESSGSVEFEASLGWPLSMDMSTDELLDCPELDEMEECLMTAYSPSSVLDLDSASPSSVLDSTYFDECGSPLHISTDVKARIDINGDTHEKLGSAISGECVKAEPSSAIEPLFEAFGKFCDSLGSNTSAEDPGFTCHEFPPLCGSFEDDGDNLMSFDLDAEALAWINIQPSELF